MNAARLFDAARLRLADAPTTALGELVVPRPVLGVRRAPKVKPRGEAWHLGILLLTPDAVLETGEIVRALPEVRRGYAAESQRQRAEIAAAVSRGGYPEGTPVHLAWRVLDLSALREGRAVGPLTVKEGIPCIRWSGAGGYQRLDRYLDERIDLALHPGERGAS